MASDLIRKRIKFAGDVHKELLKVGWDLETATGFVNNIPDADAVEVVRCKDCEYGEIDDIDIPSQYLCHYEGYSWNDENHYCSYGKKVE